MAWCVKILIRGARLQPSRKYDRSVMVSVAHALQRDNPKLQQFLDPRYSLASSTLGAKAQRAQREGAVPDCSDACEVRLRELVDSGGDHLFWEIALTRTAAWVRERRTAGRKSEPRPTNWRASWDRKGVGGLFRQPVRLWNGADSSHPADEGQEAEEGPAG